MYSSEDLWNAVIVFVCVVCLVYVVQFVDARERAAAAKERRQYRQEQRARKLAAQSPQHDLEMGMAARRYFWPRPNRRPSTSSVSSVTSSAPSIPGDMKKFFFIQGRGIMCGDASTTDSRRSHKRNPLKWFRRRNRRNDRPRVVRVLEKSHSTSELFAVCEETVEAELDHLTRIGSSKKYHRTKGPQQLPMRTALQRRHSFSILESLRMDDGVLERVAALRIACRTKKPNVTSRGLHEDCSPQETSRHVKTVSYDTDTVSLGHTKSINKDESETSASSYQRRIMFQDSRTTKSAPDLRLKRKDSRKCLTRRRFSFRGSRTKRSSAPTLLCVNCGSTTDSTKIWMRHAETRRRARPSFRGGRSKRSSIIRECTEPSVIREDTELKSRNSSDSSWCHIAPAEETDMFKHSELQRGNTRQRNYDNGIIQMEEGRNTESTSSDEWAKSKDDLFQHKFTPTKGQVGKIGLALGKMFKDPRRRVHPGLVNGEKTAKNEPSANLPQLADGLAPGQ